MSSPMPTAALREGAVDADPPVLVVEDYPDLRLSVALLLRLSGIPAAEVAGGAEALAYLRSHPPPRLVLLDLVMRGVDGVAFREAQLRDPDLAAVPVAVWNGTSLRAKWSSMSCGNAGKRAILESSTSTVNR